MKISDGRERPCLRKKRAHTRAEALETLVRRRALHTDSLPAMILGSYAAIAQSRNLMSDSGQGEATLENLLLVPLH